MSSKEKPTSTPAEAEAPAAEETLHVQVRCDPQVQPAHRIIPHVYAATAEVLADLAAVGIGKGRTNTQQNYKFRGIDDVYNVLSGFLANRRLLILPRVISRSQVDRESKSGAALFYTTVEVEYDLVSALDGSKHTTRYYGEAMDSGDKGMNKALTAAFKYMCFQMFCIPIEGNEEGRDADFGSHDVKPTRKPEVRKEPEQSPQEFVDLIEIAPSMDKLRDVFGQAWKGYPEQDFRKRFQAAYDVRKAALVEGETP